MSCHQSEFWQATVGAQSELSADPDKLVLCSPLRPAQHIAITTGQLSARQPLSCTKPKRVTPGKEARIGIVRCCRVRLWLARWPFWHEECAEPVYQIYTGLLFGCRLRLHLLTGAVGLPKLQEGGSCGP